MKKPAASIRSDRLFESHPNAISLPPNDITGKWNIISLEDDTKTFGDILGITTSIAAPEILMSHIKQLTVMSANLITPDINTCGEPSVVP
jgi:hypothetical protein